MGEVDLDQIFSECLTHTFPDIIGAILKKKSRQGGFRAWGLKFDNPSGMELCQSLFPECKFIHIIRDGRDVHLSACRCLNEGYHNPLFNAEFWKRLIEERRSFAQQLDENRYIELRYEDVLSRPQKYFSILSYYLNTPEARFKYMDIKSGNFNKWQQFMTADDIHLYETIAGDVLTKSGYTLQFSDKKRVTKKVRWMNSLTEPVATSALYLQKLYAKEKRHAVVHKAKMKISKLLRMV